MRAPSSRKRYLSVWLRRLMTDRLIRSGRSPAPADPNPLVVAEPVKGALRLAGLNDVADGLGLKPGMALADARAMYPGIAVADADPDADRRTLVAIADWCDRYTPLVGLDPPDGLLLDITGCAHLFGGEEAIAPGHHGAACTRRDSRRGRRWPTPSAAPGRWRAMARSCASSRTETARRAAPAPARGAADRAGDRRPTLAQVGLKRIADVDRPSARAARRALRRAIRAPHRPGGRPRRRADHAAPAGAGFCDRAALRRADRARSRRARHHRASCA